jgi:competence protein ComEC
MYNIFADMPLLFARNLGINKFMRFRLIQLEYFSRSFMKIWHQLPLVRLIIPFISGILTAIYNPCQIENFSLIIIPYILIIGFIVLVPSFRISYRKSWIFGLAITVLLFGLGYQLTISKTQKYSRDHFSNFLTGQSNVHARLAASPIEKAKSLKVIIEIIEVKVFEQWIPTTGKAMAYIYKDERSLKLKYGDEVFINSGFRGIDGPQNPGEFDYKSFLMFHNITEVSYIKSEEWKETGINSGNGFLTSCYMIRDNLLQILREKNVMGDEYAVGAALLLGYSDMLDPEIISAYSETGALHILSVSGLHVAIVYMIFNSLLFFLDKFKKGPFIKAIFLITALWMYAALTGLSPSVLRAATMFTFIIIAKTFDFHTNIYNTLAASAFLLLSIDPFLIMEVGFQLSYIAVAGIVYIQPIIFNKFEPSGWLMHQAWGITTVSIAAQIATFPLGLHYFHQFPNYFLISNFIVIPVSTLIIYLGIALFAFSKISFIAIWLGVGFSWMVWLLNHTVQMIEKWPHALIQGISISVFETLLIYIIVLGLLYYFTKKAGSYLITSLLALILFLCLQIKEQYFQNNQKKLIVYNIRNVSAIDFIQNRSNTLLTNPEFGNNQNALSFSVKQNWYELGIKYSKIIYENYESPYLFVRNNFILFNRKKIIIWQDLLNAENPDLPLVNRMKVDYLIISKNPKTSIGDILKIFAPEKIIFDSSNSEHYFKKCELACREFNQDFYSVTRDGAFIADL